jgi:transposase-like protein
MAFTAERLHRPPAVEQLQEIVAGSRLVRAVGTGHSFNRMADTSGDCVSVAGLPPTVDIDAQRGTVTVAAGMRYGEMATRLPAAGHALRNLGPRLPHFRLEFHSQPRSGTPVGVPGAVRARRRALAAIDQIRDRVAEQRRRFSAQFKAEAVQMVPETGKPIAEVARDLGIHDGTLGNWVNTWRREHPEPEPGITPVERARLKEMEDEVRRLRMENEFLKKVFMTARGLAVTGAG